MSMMPRFPAFVCIRLAAPRSIGGGAFGLERADGAALFAKRNGRVAPELI